ncbi:penicillin-binding protein 1A [Elioraea rosea]|uniref:penicillin-binding protein 1A n=1 Tax=Elioraea rosea TaxID=2492390 RepID=UPI001185B424|nr:penicillin-binding protein 1A [Elioraea rosea]
MHADQPLAARGRGSGKAAPHPETPDDGAPQPAKPRKVRKRRRGAFARFVTFLFSAALVLAVFGGIGAVIAWQHFARDLPDHARLTDYEPPVMSRVYAGDSRLLAELATERRVFVPIVAIPKLVQDAFVSAEDQNFWSHPGIDLLAIARAAVTNLQQMGQGRRPVGASTITQQVAKNMLLSNEVSLARKAREAILALKIEEVLPKQRILELYLNEIFLGQGAYGVAAASMAYFGKALDELTPAEVAFLAALPKAPNNYNPFRFPEAAKGRRDWVLDRMADDRVITAEAAEAAKAEPVTVRPGRFAERVPAEYFAEEVRRQLIDRFGQEETTQGGLTVRTSLDPVMQEAADRALRDGLIAYDRRRGGWRGPVAQVELPAEQLRTAWTERLAAVARPAGALPGWRTAIVLEVTDQEARLGLLERGARPGVPPQPRILPLPMSEMAWARKALPENRLGPQPRRPAEVVSPGDVVLVEVLEAEPAIAAARGRAARAALPERLALRQMPLVEGALVALDPHTGRVLALSGGWNFERSWFNRATQANRQTGSSFKPFVYLAALERNMSPVQRILDAPFVVDQGPGLGRWRPTNYNAGEFGGPTPMRVGMEKSKNLMTIRLAEMVGLEAVASVAARTGVIPDMQRSYSMALGAGETTVIRMAAGFAAFVNGGRAVTPTLIDTVQDRQGQVIYRADGRDCTGCTDAQPSAAPPEAPDNRSRATDPASAFQMVSMLQGVIQRGTGGRAAIDRPAAGKTGTTNDFLDAWFVGFTPDLVAAIWIGFDEPQPLGNNEAGGVVAAPVFSAFMREALKGRPALPFRTPPGLRMVRVNAETGEPAGPGERNAIMEAFKPGTEPGAAGAAEGVLYGLGAQAGADGEGNALPSRRPAAALDAGLGGLY